MSKFPPHVVAAAQRSKKKWGVPAAVTLAQWAIESVYGEAIPPGSNNCFGIKARRGEPRVMWMSREVLHGQTPHILQAFSKFASLEEAFDAHAKLLTTSHFFAHAWQYKDDPDEFARALTGVYAIDQNYGEILISLMRSYNLYEYDFVEEVVELPPPIVIKAPFPTYRKAPAEIAWIQQSLNQANASTPPLMVDGKYGAKTEQALRSFQRRVGLPENGEIGPITLTALEEVVKAAARA